MIIAENISYGIPQKELYDKVSFTIDEKDHCAFIGTNGTGKSTLLQMIREPEEYLFDGKLKISRDCKIGYISQFYEMDRLSQITVFDYLSESFLALQNRINYLCDEMSTTEDMDAIFEQYQEALDTFTAVDGDSYESNIKKQLKLAGLHKQENLEVSKLSGGEFKLLQVIKEMMKSPNLLIMDEPDVFLDFEHVISLKNLINNYKGTMIVVTHNRFLLHHCFHKILHLEDTKIMEFPGNYQEYQAFLLRQKVELQELALADVEEIERNQKVVDKMRKQATMIDSATLGRRLHARVSLLERLEARKRELPFLNVKSPNIVFETTNEMESEKALTISNLHIGFDEVLLDSLCFSIGAKEKVAIVGNNGTGKTTLIRQIFQNNKEEIKFDSQAQVAFLSQVQNETLDENNTIVEEFELLGLETKKQVLEYISKYGITEDMLVQKIGKLSGGEKQLLQLAKIELSNGNFLLLDEPTSHLDTYAQIAFEKAIKEYNGAVLLISHDFYTITNCVDYVLLVDGKGLRKISVRKFRKMIYEEHFSLNFLEWEQKKKDIEGKIEKALIESNLEVAKSKLEELENLLRV